MFKLIRVTGRSLEPTYQDGDYVLVSRVPVLLGRIRKGDVVVFRHKVHGILIKTVGRLSGSGSEIFVSGSHVFSVDSRSFGTVAKRDLVGKVIWHFKKPAA